MGAYGGIHAVQYAFFGTDGRVDRGAMRIQAAACLASGVAGLVVLGLATEVSKLSAGERRGVVEGIMEDAGGRVPVGVTIFGRTPEEQIGAMRVAEGAGASWVILQPPVGLGLDDAGLLGFYAPVFEAARGLVAVQNAPALMGVGLSAAGLEELARRHGNLVALKAEGSAVEVRDVVERTGVAVLNGRGGLELTDTVRAGAVGNIPAPDCCDVLVRAWAAMEAGQAGEAGREEEAEALYARVLPVIAFAMQGVDHLVCYGKRVVGARLGIIVRDRGPGVVASEFGEELARRYAAALGPYPNG